MRSSKEPAGPSDEGDGQANGEKRAYEKPAFIREQVFETMALACGKIDPTLAAKQVAVAAAMAPLPEDAGVTQRKTFLAGVSKPVQEDSRLIQLRIDADFSTKQLANKRLTAAQDLAWVLINSPAFLFNH